ncbi:hypothetical protein SKTS_21760 [Sulfurimicrobium lacus]|uniref:Single-stranded DNA-binding protein n=1 Tax=Sulfurimicrobium lacus TaxID=2715678 RepID=A0A6F8VD75_9PROT|nr:hypothetical protein [Sulfurimicrobium lacus]BCB27290.1 hypothetical protein SKTS_21760 [Sulfurimicrobium lacus]
MHATYTAKVVGLKANKGEFDSADGKKIKYDYTKVFVELSLRGDKSRGVATEEYNVGDSDLFDTIKHIPLPFMCEIDMEKTSTGSEEREQVVGFRPTAAVSTTTGEVKPSVANLKSAS